MATKGRRPAGLVSTTFTQIRAEVEQLKEGEEGGLIYGNYNDGSLGRGNEVW